jgi:saccharopine dehydrogenase-like NADP-dependent oxidoreductase
MDEKTIRYPGHADKVKTLVETGLFESEPLVLGIKPRDFMEAFLSSKLRLGKSDRDITILEVEVKGESEMIRYRMLDRFDEKNNITSMSRTTGYPLAVVSMMVAEKKVEQKGVIPLEILGSNKKLSELVLEELHKRNIRIEEETLKNESR